MNERKRYIDSRIKVLLPKDLRNQNEVDVLRSFRLALLLARQSFLRIGRQCTMEPLFFLPWPIQKNCSKPLKLLLRINDIQHTIF
jgi:hypothetical protein